MASITEAVAREIILTKGRIEDDFLVAPLTKIVQGGFYRVNALGQLAEVYTAAGTYPDIKVAWLAMEDYDNSASATVSTVRVSVITKVIARVLSNAALTPDNMGERCFFIDNNTVDQATTTNLFGGHISTIVPGSTTELYLDMTAT